MGVVRLIYDDEQFVKDFELMPLAGGSYSFYIVVHCSFVLL